MTNRKTTTKAKPKPDEKQSTPPIINFEFRTDGQRKAWETIKKNQVTFLTGKAGTAKTYLAVAYALKATMEWEKFREIIAIRPAVEAGEKNGALPGPIDEKVRPFLEPIYNAINKICGPDQPLKQSVLKILKTHAVGYIRGLTFENSVVILDEAQNINRRQMQLFLTRLGSGSKFILCGDTRQSDIGRMSVMAKAARAMQGIGGIGWYEFGPEDQMREPLVNQMDDVMEQLDTP